MAPSPVTTGQIAVVVTCHDLGRTLIEALESVERQTRAPAQIVVVDDQSTDLFTKQIVTRIAANGTWVVGGPGRGASAARNLGASLTGTDYIVWLDADDILEPTWLEVAAARLDADPELAFVSCAMRAFGEASYVWTPAAPDLVSAVSTGAVPHASTMVRRELWAAVGGFDEEVPSFELLDFWASAFERGARGTIVDEPLLNYRVRAGSGYRRSIQPETYSTRLAHFYSKHRGAVERHAEELILGKEAFLQGQRDYRKSLDSRARALEAELAQLQAEVAEAAAALESRGDTRVEWGEFGRVEPLSRQWGRDRGKAIDRHYIEWFLHEHAPDIRGRVLEVRDSAYTRRFGGDAVTVSDVIDIDRANSHATVLADLRRADAVRADTYDCIILTQTLQLIDDVRAVLGEAHRMLRPGGVLLVTVPCIIRVDDEGGVDGDFWRFTEASARTLFAETFRADDFEVTSFGNVKSSAAFLYGVSAEELAAGDLDHTDSAFPMVIAVRAVKSATPLLRAIASGGAPRVHRPGAAGAILSYHRIADLAPDTHALCTPPDVFQEQMAILRRECCPIALEDLVDAAASGRVPERAVAITFDDGYLDALTTASPILAELGVPATFFVNSDRLDQEHERPWDVLERLFLCGPALPAVLTLTHGGQPCRMATATERERAETLERVNQMMWTLDGVGRTAMVSAIIRWSGGSDKPRSSHRVLTGDEIRSLSARPGHTIGAHTTHHLALTTQPAATRRREVFENKAALESIVQKPIHLFAYPYGEVDAELAAMVSKAGFRAAVTVEKGLVYAGTNRLMLPRFEVAAADGRDGFARRLAGIFEGTALCGRSL